MVDLINNLWQNINYGVLKNKPSIDFTQIPSHLKAHTYYDKKNKVYFLEAVDLPDFVVTGKTKEELTRNFYDTLTVYFDVPTYFARRLRPPSVKSVFTNQKDGNQESITVNYKKELDKVLA